MATLHGRTGWGQSARTADAQGAFGADARILGQTSADGAMPLSHERKWPAWAVTLGVAAFCGAFWTGVGYLMAPLFA